MDFVFRNELVWILVSSSRSNDNLRGAELKEEWRRVHGFKYYEVSSMGRVRSLSRSTQIRHKGKTLYRKYVGKILNTANKVNNAGYNTCYLGRNNSHFVHVLVAKAFHGCPKGKQVNHLNCDKSDNRAINLRWVTPSENIRHAIKSGRFEDHCRNMSSRSQGEKNVKAKLNNKSVIAILMMYGTGQYTYRLLAEKFRVATCTVSRIVKNRSWRHIRGIKRGPSSSTIP